jgi:hypothetical protein
VDPNSFSRTEWLALVPGMVGLEHAVGSTVLARAIAFWTADLVKYGPGSLAAASACEALDALRAIDPSDPRLS